MPFSWMHILLSFFLSPCTCMDSAFSSSSFSMTGSYTDHCSSVVPQSSPTVRTYRDSVPLLSTFFITGGGWLLDTKPGNEAYYYYYMGKSLKLEFLPKCYETIADGVYKVEALMYIYSAYRKSESVESIRFSLEGFWSEISRKLCMVGSAFWKSEEGKFIDVDAVLKLKYANENWRTSPANDPGYFDPILIFSFPVLPNYNYSLVSKDLHGVLSSGFGLPENQSLSLQPTNFCSVLGRSQTVLELEYAAECRQPQHCSPLGAGNGSIGVLLPFLSLIPIQCSDGEKKLRYTGNFHDTHYPGPCFGLDSTMIVEASWDDTNFYFIFILGN